MNVKLNPIEVDSFSKKVIRNNWYYDRITIDICIENKTYEVGRADRPIKFKKDNLTTEA